MFDEISELVTDARHGKDREMLTVALGNMRNPQAINLLIRLLEDEEVAGHALIALRKRGDPAAVPYVLPFLTHERTWVRNEAKKALNKLTR
jgi:HEAT repeat protein